MQVDVEDRLACFAVAVEDRPVSAFGIAMLFRERSGRRVDRLQQVCRGAHQVERAQRGAGTGLDAAPSVYQLDFDQYWFTDLVDRHSAFAG